VCEQAQSGVQSGVLSAASAKLSPDDVIIVCFSMTSRYVTGSPQSHSSRVPRGFVVACASSLAEYAMGTFCSMAMRRLCACIAAAVALAAVEAAAASSPQGSSVPMTLAQPDDWGHVRRRRVPLCALTHPFPSRNSSSSKDSGHLRACLRLPRARTLIRRSTTRCLRFAFSLAAGACLA
jgi:hypothetical protein